MEMTKNGPQLTDHAPIEIAIVCYPGAQATCIHGLTDLFTYADYFARMHAGQLLATIPRPAPPGDRPFLQVTHWRERSTGTGLECDGEASAGGRKTPAIVVIPACQLGPPDSGSSPRTTAWAAQRHEEGAVITAVCGGVFLLAESGLLNGRRVTTHWMFAAELARRFPEMIVEPERLVIDDHDVVTAGGVLGWADMGLGLVERLLGSTVMLSTARFMLMDPPRQEQRVYSDFSPPLQHGDKAILAIQHWMQVNASAAITIANLADRAGIGMRTFLRRFVKATGMKPSEYHQRLRIARSRELLELTRDTVDQIAAAAGYEDTGGFRRVFKRVTGLSPAEYRRRFQRRMLPVSRAPRAAVSG